MNHNYNNSFHGPYGYGQPSQAQPPQHFSQYPQGSNPPGNGQDFQMQQVLARLQALEMENANLRNKLIESNEENFNLQASMATIEVEAKHTAGEELQKVQSELNFKKKQLEEQSREYKKIYKELSDIRVKIKEEDITTPLSAKKRKMDVDFQKIKLTDTGNSKGNGETTPKLSQPPSIKLPASTNIPSAESKNKGSSRPPTPAANIEQPTDNKNEKSTKDTPLSFEPAGRALRKRAIQDLQKDWNNILVMLINHPVYLTVATEESLWGTIMKKMKSNNIATDNSDSNEMQVTSSSGSTTTRRSDELRKDTPSQLDEQIKFFVSEMSIKLSEVLERNKDESMKDIKKLTEELLKLLYDSLMILSHYFHIWKTSILNWNKNNLPLDHLQRVLKKYNSSSMMHGELPGDTNDHAPGKILSRTTTPAKTSQASISSSANTARKSVSKESANNGIAASTAAAAAVEEPTTTAQAVTEEDEKIVKIQHVEQLVVQLLQFVYSLHETLLCIYPPVSLHREYKALLKVHGKNITSNTVTVDKSTKSIPVRTNLMNKFDETVPTASRGNRNSFGTVQNLADDIDSLESLVSMNIEKILKRSVKLTIHSKATPETGGTNSSSTSTPYTTRSTASTTGGIGNTIQPGNNTKSSSSSFNGPEISSKTYTMDDVPYAGFSLVSFLEPCGKSLQQKNLSILPSIPFIPLDPNFHILHEFSEYYQQLISLMKEIWEFTIQTQLSIPMTLFSRKDKKAIVDPTCTCDFCVSERKAEEDAKLKAEEAGREERAIDYILLDSIMIFHVIIGEYLLFEYSMETWEGGKIPNNPTTRLLQDLLSPTIRKVKENNFSSEEDCIFPKACEELFQNHTEYDYPVLLLLLGHPDIQYTHKRILINIIQTMMIRSPRACELFFRHQIINTASIPSFLHKRKTWMNDLDVRVEWQESFVPIVPPPVTLQEHPPQRVPLRPLNIWFPEIHSFLHYLIDELTYVPTTRERKSVPSPRLIGTRQPKRYAHQVYHLQILHWLQDLARKYPEKFLQALLHLPVADNQTKHRFTTASSQENALQTMSRSLLNALCVAWFYAWKRLEELDFTDAKRYLSLLVSEESSNHRTMRSPDSMKPPSAMNIAASSIPSSIPMSSIPEPTTPQQQPTTQQQPIEKVDVFTIEQILSTGAYGNIARYPTSQDQEELCTERDGYTPQERQYAVFLAWQFTLLMNEIVGCILASALSRQPIPSSTATQQQQQQRSNGNKMDVDGDEEGENIIEVDEEDDEEEVEDTSDDEEAFAIRTTHRSRRLSKATSSTTKNRSSSSKTRSNRVTSTTAATTAETPAPATTTSSSLPGVGTGKWIILQDCMEYINAFMYRYYVHTLPEVLGTILLPEAVKHFDALSAP